MHLGGYRRRPHQPCNSSTNNFLHPVVHAATSNGCLTLDVLARKYDYSCGLHSDPGRAETGQSFTPRYGKAVRAYSGDTCEVCAYPHARLWPTFPRRMPDRRCCSGCVMATRLYPYPNIGIYPYPYSARNICTATLGVRLAHATCCTDAMMAIITASVRTRMLLRDATTPDVMVAGTWIKQQGLVVGPGL